MDLSNDEFTVFYDASLIDASQMLDTIAEIGFQPSVVQSRVNLVGAKKIIGAAPHMVQTALAEARTNGKLVFIDFFAKWCGACLVMDKTTFTDPAVKDLLSERYIFLKIDTDRHPEVGQHFNIVGLPTIIALNGLGEIVYRHTGPLSAERLVDVLTNTITARMGKSKTAFE